MVLINYSHRGLAKIPVGPNGCGLRKSGRCAENTSVQWKKNHSCVVFGHIACHNSCGIVIPLMKLCITPTGSIECYESNVGRLVDWKECSILRFLMRNVTCYVSPVVCTWTWERGFVSMVFLKAKWLSGVRVRVSTGVLYLKWK